METNEQEILELQDNETETIDSEVETEEVDIEALKKANATLKAQKEHWRKKAEKPEPTEKQEVEGLSQKDVIYLAKTDIHQDDIDEVVEYAKLKKITVADAHKFFKPILAERDEERKTAQATQTKGGTRSTSKITPEAILEKANKGQFSDSDDEIALLAEARRKQERAKLGK